ncbi:MAG TPA: hypothetical protein EYN67_18270 [Flavobacteriales bacterium]|nr:hypothetical protein [Methylococcaceae bacterium]HHZ97434.1 hypothetical protein [Flavobacteriales bacterium]
MQIKYFYSVLDAQGLVEWHADSALSNEAIALEVAEDYFEARNNLNWPIDFILYDSNRKYISTNRIELSSSPVFSITNKET